MPGQFLAYAYAAVLGSIIGSFLNVVIHRVPRGHSTVMPRSKCPYCDGIIRARDNLPIISFLLLKGRCHRCRAPISWRYPLLEAITALLFVACVYRFGPTAEAAVSAVFCCLLLALAAIDLEHFLLPDKLTLPGIIAGLALQAWLPRTDLLGALLGTLLGAGVLILLINIWYWVRGEEGMGLGDVNMLAMVGAFLGWHGVAVTLVVSALAGSLVGLTLIALRRLELKSRLPFGVFIAFGALVSLFFGETIVGLYRNLL